MPWMPKDKHENDARRRGLIRYCPVCNSFEVTGQMRGDSEHKLEESEAVRLQQLGTLIKGGPYEIDVEQDATVIRTGRGHAPVRLDLPRAGVIHKVGDRFGGGGYGVGGRMHLRQRAGLLCC
jgi:hypothetical protein